MKIKITPQSLLILAMVLLVLAACSPVDLTGSARDKVLAYSEPMADNLLNAITASDYAHFTRDLDDTMLQAFTQAEFTTLHDQLNSKIGQYVSRQVTTVAPTQNMMVVIYSAKYTQDDNVTVRIVFGGTPVKITGLWFNSAKLAQK
jgi:hypothetical protein